MACARSESIFCCPRSFLRDRLPVLLEDFFTPVELLEDEWCLWDEVDAVFFVGVDFSVALPVESCGGVAAAINAQLSVSAQTAPSCAFRNFAPGRIIPLTLSKKKAQPLWNRHCHHL